MRPGARYQVSTLVVDELEPSEPPPVATDVAWVTTSTALSPTAEPRGASWQLQRAPARRRVGAPREPRRHAHVLIVPHLHQRAPFVILRAARLAHEREALGVRAAGGDDGAQDLGLEADEALVVAID